MTFNSIFYVTCENKGFEVFGVRDAFGIVGWIKNMKDRKLLAYLRPICSPFIKKKDGVTEFEFNQKGAIMVEVRNEQETMVVKETLEKKTEVTVYTITNKRCLLNGYLLL